MSGVALFAAIQFGYWGLAVVVLPWLLYLSTRAVTSVFARLKSRMIFRAIGRRLDLSTDEDGALSGVVTGIPIRLWVDAGSLSLGVRGIAPGFALRMRSLDEPVTGGITGESHFDRAFEVTGDPLVAASLLSRRARQRLLDVLAPANVLDVEDGGMQLRTPVLEAGVVGVVNLLRNLVAAATVLAAPADPCAALLDIAHADENANVRRRALRIASEQWPKDESVVNANRRALADADIENRVYAARRLGRDQLDVLSNIFEAAPLVARAKALVAIVELAPPSERAGWILRGLRDDASAVRIAAVTAAGVRGVALETEIENLVLDLFTRGPGEEKQALCDLLGELGSLRAVAPLLAAHATAATSAARTIQKRAGVGERGELTVAEPSTSAGALSVTSDKGTVSLADKK